MTNNLEIYDWNDIKKNYIGGCILLGNGASIAVDSRFSYNSIFEKAIENKYLGEDSKKLFNFFETSDFELILRLVWHATYVNKSLNIKDSSTKIVYENLKNTLINLVRESHPVYDDLQETLPKISGFLKNFKTVLSLNYDLIIYWAMMQNNELKDGHIFKDCFINGSFENNWKKLKELYNEQSNTLVFYPHGNLVLCRDYLGRESKIAQKGINLLESILTEWDNGKKIPLFVSEGVKEQKIASIHNSYYLTIVYREVLTTLPRCLTVYGWGFGEQDKHLLSQIARSGIRNIAVSVLNHDQAYCHQVSAILKSTLKDIQIDFFDSASTGCWIF